MSRARAGLGFPQPDGDSDAQVDAEVEHRRNLVAHITPLRSRSRWPRRRRVTEKSLEPATQTALAGRPPRRACRFSRHEIPKQLDWISVRRGQSQQFNDATVALAAFVFGDKRLRLAKLLARACCRTLAACRTATRTAMSRIFRRFEGLTCRRA